MTRANKNVAKRYGACVVFIQNMIVRVQFAIVVSGTQSHETMFAATFVFL